MKKRTPVSEIMTSDVITLNYSDNLATAEHLFRTNGIRHIPVVSGSSIVGMLSYTDLMRISFSESAAEAEDAVESVVYNMFSIEQVMVKDVVTVSSDTTIKDVTKLLAEREFHALPIVDNSILVGIVTTTDLLNYYMKQF